jgi:hypothetical protein
MKHSLIALAGLSALLLPAASFAATVNLYNGGFGQIASNAQNFGVAICNGGTKAVTQSVPVTVATLGQTATVASAPSIAAGSCTYGYLAYAQLGMQPGNTYSVTVTIDPARTVISNKNNQAVYSITVPKLAAANGSAANGTANVGTQSGNFFSIIGNWLSSLFGGK